MGYITESPGTLLTLQNSGSGALSSGSQSACNTVDFDNRAGGNGNLCFWINVELLTGFTVAPGLITNIEFYLVPAIDGTNFADVAVPPQITSYKGSFQVVLSQTAAQRLSLELVQVQPIYYRAYIRNMTGQQMAAGWTLRVLPVSEQY